jgi:hypothetical protein
MCWRTSCPARHLYRMSLAVNPKAVVPVLVHDGEIILPIFIGLLRSFRKLAPTRLRAAGATAGLAAGASAQLRMS